MIYGYARCSTNEEMQDINRQIRELKQLAVTQGVLPMKKCRTLTDRYAS